MINNEVEKVSTHTLTLQTQHTNTLKRAVYYTETYITFRSNFKSSVFSITSFNTGLHFALSKTRAYSCPGGALPFFLPNTRDFRLPLEFDDEDRISAAS
jgi:CMP-N-acetylneuraminic acid synthetase